MEELEGGERCGDRAARNLKIEWVRPAAHMSDEGRERRDDAETWNLALFLSVSVSDAG